MEYQESITKLEEVMEFVDNNIDYRPARKYMLSNLRYVKELLTKFSEIQLLYEGDK